MPLLERSHVLAHRGFWRSASQKNTREAFIAAFDDGYGIETDLRDLGGVVVVSHDMASGEALPFSELLQIYSDVGCRSTLALNIKADGLASSIAVCLKNAAADNNFAFDMSVPEKLNYIRAGLKFFTRRSQFEDATPLDSRANGRWLDAFEGDIVADKHIAEAMGQAVPFVIVSPELHGLPYLDAWRRWRDMLNEGSIGSENFFVCTDFPDKAWEFFSE